MASVASRLLRAYATQVESLRRLRNGGSQFVRVEHVHVNEGGRAVIGPVAVDRTPERLAFVRFAHDCRFVGLVFVLFVFIFGIIVIVGITRRRCVACDAENVVDAMHPLLLQTSVKLDGIGGHVVLVLTFVLEGWRGCTADTTSAFAQVNAGATSVPRSRFTMACHRNVKFQLWRARRPERVARNIVKRKNDGHDLAADSQS
jgi:hypothetical protein